MRNILFKKWIHIKMDECGKIIPNTGCWESEFTNRGVFHQWGNAYDEFENGPGNYTVAIVELPNGTIETVLPTNIQFI